MNRDRTTALKKALRHILNSFLPALAAILFMLLLPPVAGTAKNLESEFHGAGVIDRSGRTIIPCKYRMVRSSTCGYWLLTKYNPEMPFAFNGEQVVADKDGNIVGCRLPVGDRLRAERNGSSAGRLDHRKCDLGWTKLQ